MAEAARRRFWTGWLRRADGEVVSRSDVRRAYGLLRAALVALPLATGADKIGEVELVTRWSDWLSPRLAALSPLGSRELLRIAGMVEACIAALVLLRPRVGAPVLAAWLALVVVNLASIGGRRLPILLDATIAIAALALSRLAAHYESARAAELQPGPPP
jgi:hypothetical protein